MAVPFGQQPQPHRSRRVIEAVEGAGISPELRAVAAGGYLEIVGRQVFLLSLLTRFGPNAARRAQDRVVAARPKARI
jgi:hypothetical protein